MLEVTVDCVQSAPTVVLNTQTAQLHVEPFFWSIAPGPRHSNPVILLVKPSTFTETNKSECDQGPMRE